MPIDFGRGYGTPAYDYGEVAREMARTDAANAWQAANAKSRTIQNVSQGINQGINRFADRQYDRATEERSYGRHRYDIEQGQGFQTERDAAQREFQQQLDERNFEQQQEITGLQGLTNFQNAVQKKHAELLQRYDYSPATKAKLDGLNEDIRKIDLDPETRTPAKIAAKRLKYNEMFTLIPDVARRSAAERAADNLVETRADGTQIYLDEHNKPVALLPASKSLEQTRRANNQIAVNSSLNRVDAAKKNRLDPQWDLEADYLEMQFGEDITPSEQALVNRIRDKQNELTLPNGPTDAQEKLSSKQRSDEADRADRMTIARANHVLKMRSQTGQDKRPLYTADEINKSADDLFGPVSGAQPAEADAPTRPSDESISSAEGTKALLEAKLDSIKNNWVYSNKLSPEDAGELAKANSILSQKKAHDDWMAAGKPRRGARQPAAAEPLQDVAPPPTEMPPSFSSGPAGAQQQFVPQPNLGSAPSAPQDAQTTATPSPVAAKAQAMKSQAMKSGRKDVAAAISLLQSLNGRMPDPQSDPRGFAAVMQADALLEQNGIDLIGQPKSAPTFTPDFSRNFQGKF